LGVCGADRLRARARAAAPDVAPGHAARGDLPRRLRLGERARAPGGGDALHPARRPARGDDGRPAAGPARPGARGDRLMGALLELKRVSKAFGGLSCVTDLDLVVNDGEIVSLIGPNGAGKTTVFNLVTGVYRPDGGDIALEGE